MNISSEMKSLVARTLPENSLVRSIVEGREAFVARGLTMAGSAKIATKIDTTKQNFLAQSRQRKG